MREHRDDRVAKCKLRKGQLRTPHSTLLGHYKRERRSVRVANGSPPSASGRLYRSTGTAPRERGVDQRNAGHGYRLPASADAATQEASLGAAAASVRKTMWSPPKIPQNLIPDASLLIWPGLHDVPTTSIVHAPLECAMLSQQHPFWRFASPWHIVVHIGANAVVADLLPGDAHGCELLHTRLPYKLMLALPILFLEALPAPSCTRCEILLPL